MSLLFTYFTTYIMKRKLFTMLFNVVCFLQNVVHHAPFIHLLAQLRFYTLSVVSSD